MKYLKTYEGKHTKYKIGNYIVWNDEDIWEICEIISKTNLNTIRVLDKFYLKDYNLNTHTSEFNTPSNIDLLSKEERDAIKYVSDDLEDCKERIILMATANKYNL